MTDTAAPGRSQSLGIGQIIGQSFSLTFGNFVPLLLVIIVPFLIAGGAGYLMFGSIANQMMGAMVSPAAQEALAQEIMSNWVQYVALYLVFLLIVALAFSFAYGAAVHVLFESKLGKRVNLGEAFGTGLSRMPALFLTTLVLSLILIVITAAISYAFAVTGLPLVGQLVLVVFSLYLSGLLAPLAAVIVVERLWFGAYGRTMRLTAGYRWWIVLLFIVFALAMLVIYLVMGLIGWLVAQIGGTVAGILMAIVGLIGMVIVFGTGTGIIALVYARLREIKEGTTIESLADIFE